MACCMAATTQNIHLALERQKISWNFGLFKFTKFNLMYSCSFRGQNPLHILAQYAKEHAVAIFNLFRQSMPDYPLNALDAEENTGEYLLQ